MESMLISVRVVAKRMEARGICSFELADCEGGMLPPFTAGAHIDVHAPGAIRQYSLCNAPSERHRYQIAVLRDPASRGGSVAMHDAVSEGDVLQISAPRNLFALDAQAAHTLLLAGGIGVTPIIAMAEQLAAEGAGFDMHYLTRDEANTAFAERLARAPYASRVSLHRDDKPQEKLDLPRLLAQMPPRTHLYVCGPAGFIAHVRQAASQQGWPESRVHYELFAAPAGAPAEGGAFEVRVASTGEVYAIPADRPVTDVLREHGVDIPVSCEQGVCGTCLTGILEGEPEHRDMFLTPEEQARNDQFTPCCSRARSACLVLDI